MQISNQLFRVIRRNEDELLTEVTGAESVRHFLLQTRSAFCNKQTYLERDRQCDNNQLECRSALLVLRARAQLCI